MISDSLTVDRPVRGRHGGFRFGQDCAQPLHAFRNAGWRCCALDSAQANCRLFKNWRVLRKVSQRLRVSPTQGWSRVPNWRNLTRRARRAGNVAVACFRGSCGSCRLRKGRVGLATHWTVEDFLKTVDWTSMLQPLSVRYRVADVFRNGRCHERFAPISAAAASTVMRFANDGLRTVTNTSPQNVRSFVTQLARLE